MQCKRTANAGVLLELDGVSILLDGVCAEVKPYQPTSEDMRQALLDHPPDCVAFTHGHLDHCDVSFIPAYLEKTAGPVLGPADIPLCEVGSKQIENVKITPVECRHLGKSDGAAHQAYIIEGSRCVWFMGDAAPATWRRQTQLPRPDVILAPYAYATGSSWRLCSELGAETVVLLHLPEEGNDPYGLWDAVRQTVGSDPKPRLLIPQMGETLDLS